LRITKVCNIALNKVFNFIVILIEGGRGRERERERERERQKEKKS